MSDNTPFGTVYLPLWSFNHRHKSMYELSVYSWLNEDKLLTWKRGDAERRPMFDVNVYIDGEKEYNSCQPRSRSFLNKRNPYYASYSEETAWDTLDNYVYGEPSHYGMAIFEWLEENDRFDLIMSDRELDEVTGLEQCYLYVTKRMTDCNYGKELYGYLVATQDGKNFEVNIVIGRHYAHDIDTAKFLVRTLYNELIRQYKADFNDSGNMTDAHKQIKSIMGAVADEDRKYEVNALIEAIDGYGDEQKEYQQGLINSGRIEFMINRKEVDMEDIPF